MSSKAFDIVTRCRALKSVGVSNILLKPPKGERSVFGVRGSPVEEGRLSFPIDELLEAALTKASRER